MNEHLKPVFEKILPKIFSSHIKYWVYGGIGLAAIKGGFYRYNSDVDVFVEDINFPRIKKILEDACKENGWEPRETCLKTGRPKIDILIEGNEVMSVIPVYLRGEFVKFMFLEGSKEYSAYVLEQKERHLGGFYFFTPSDDFIKVLFINYLESKTKYPYKRIEDARQICSKEEFMKFFPNEAYDIGNDLNG